MKVSFKKVFSIIDGRLSTTIGDVYEMLNYIFDANLATHQLPEAMSKLREENPNWFNDAVCLLNDIKSEYDTNDFKELMSIIDVMYGDYEIEICKLNKPL